MQMAARLLVVHTWVKKTTRGRKSGSRYCRQGRYCASSMITVHIRAFPKMRCMKEKSHLEGAIGRDARLW